MSLEQARQRFQEADFTAALEAFDKADLHQALSREEQELKAQCLLEIKEAKQASQIYEELGLYNQAAFAAVLDQDLSRATKLIKQAIESPARKWVSFLLEFLQSGDQLSLASPGYLTFRLYTEATLGYFLTYGLEDYFNKFMKHRNDLAQAYPEVIKDIGSAHLARKEYKTALTLLEEAKDRFIHDAGVHFKAASAHFGLDQPEKAKPFLETVYKLLPGSTLVKRLLNKV